MKNAQKAQEIAKVHEVHYDRLHGETSNDECFLSALEMAEWKDQQFKKVIEYAEICYGVFSFNQREDFINKIKKLYEVE